VRLAAALAVVAALGLPAPAAGGLRAPSGGEVRALVVGIDQYANLRSLKGAAADARDIAQALRGAGVDNMTVLIDRDATRQAIVGAMERLVRDARANDFVIITFAGHGAQVPERVRGSKPDGKDEVYVLRDYDPNTRRGTPDIIIGPEIKHWVGALEAKGVDVFVVADTCHGGGLTRNADRRAEPESYRAIDLAAEAAADLKPISQPTDAFRDESTFKRVTFLAAVDRNSLAPEVVIPGVPTKRGALSYAVARMIEAAAAARAEDRVTRTALYSYARQVVSQYAQQKQVIVTEPTRGTGVLDAVVWQAGRTRLQGPGGAAVAAETAPGNPPIKLPPVRVAALNDAAGQLARIKPLFTPFTPVAGVDQADLVWDAKAKEAIVAGDVIARDITAEDLPAVIDRVRALAEIAKLSETHPQTIELTPDGKLHRAASQVGFVARDLRGRYTIIFNLTGSGRIQYLFPNPRDGSARTPDRPKIETAEWKLDLKVDQPFGADTLVVITSDRHLDALEEALRGLDGRSAAGRLPELLRTMLPASARIGFASLFTAP